MRMLIWVSTGRFGLSGGKANVSLGRHHIRYAIFPHIGPLDHRTVRAGYNFNNPLRIHHHPNPGVIEPLLSSLAIEGAPNLILDAVKRGEDDEDVSLGELPKRKGRSVIVRVYDSLGGKSKGLLRWGNIPVKNAWKTNVLEDELEEIKIHSSGEGIEIELRAFEVATYRLQL